MSSRGALLPVTLIAVTLIASSRLDGQQAASSPAQPAAVSSDSLASVLDAYTSCKFSDGMKVVQVDPLAPGVTARSVDTADGPKRIELLAGRRVMFAYANTDFYANVKVELLPASNYPQLKQALVDNFQQMTAGNAANAALPSTLHGFEVQGVDRNMLEGGVLGLYLLFDAAPHVATTIYLFNQNPKGGKFESLEEYNRMRDQFLEAYTSCIRANQHQP